MFSFQLIRIRGSPAFLPRRCDFTGSCFFTQSTFFYYSYNLSQRQIFFLCFFVSCAAKIKTRHQTSTLHPLGVFFSQVFKLTTVDWFCWNWQAAPCWDTCKILERKQCKLLKKPYHARLCFLHQRCVFRIWYLVEVSTFKKACEPFEHVTFSVITPSLFDDIGSSQLFLWFFWHCGLLQHVWVQSDWSMLKYLTYLWT